MNFAEFSSLVCQLKTSAVFVHDFSVLWSLVCVNSLPHICLLGSCPFRFENKRIVAAKKSC